MIGRVYHQEKVCLFSSLRIEKTNENTAIFILHLCHGEGTDVQEKAPPCWNNVLSFPAKYVGKRLRQRTEFYL